MDSRKGNGPGECQWCGAKAGTLQSHREHANKKALELEKRGKIPAHFQAHFDRLFVS